MHPHQHHQSLKKTLPLVSTCLLNSHQCCTNHNLLQIADVIGTISIDVPQQTNIVRDNYIVLSAIVFISLVLGFVINLNLIQQLRVQPRSSSSCRSSVLHYMRLERVRNKAKTGVPHLLIHCHMKLSSSIHFKYLHIFCAPVVLLTQLVILLSPTPPFTQWQCFFGHILPIIIVDQTNICLCFATTLCR